MTFGENLRKLRKEQGYTQTELADLLGVGKTTIINWEKGNTMPKGKETINKLQMILNIKNEIKLQDPYDIINIYSEILIDDKISDKEKLNLIFNLQCEYIDYISDPVFYKRKVEEDRQKS